MATKILTNIVDSVYMVVETGSLSVKFWRIFMQHQGENDPRCAGPILRMAYPNRIRPFRYQRGYTQVRLASLVGVSPSLISAVERGERPCYPKLCQRICDVLGVTTEEIFGGEEEGCS